MARANYSSLGIVLTVAAAAALFVGLRQRSQLSPGGTRLAPVIPGGTPAGSNVAPIPGIPLPSPVIPSATPSVQQFKDIVVLINGQTAGNRAIVQIGGPAELRVEFFYKGGGMTGASIRSSFREIIPPLPFIPEEPFFAPQIGEVVWYEQIDDIHVAPELTWTGYEVTRYLFPPGFISRQLDALVEITISYQGRVWTPVVVGPIVRFLP